MGASGPGAGTFREESETFRERNLNGRLIHFSFRKKQKAKEMPTFRKKPAKLLILRPYYSDEKSAENRDDEYDDGTSDEKSD